MRRTAQQIGMWLLALLLVTAVLPATSSADTADGTMDETRETDIGEPVQRFHGPGSAIGTLPDGSPAWYSVAVGDPSVFVALRIRTGEVVFRAELPGGRVTQSSGIDVAPNGDVYIGTTVSGKMYRWVPGSDHIDDLGRAVSGETHIYPVTVADDGRVYGGTKPNGKVFDYDPSTGETRDYGTMIEGQEYVRSLAAANGKIYAGTLGQARLVELDPDTGAINEIPLPEGYSNESAVYSLRAAGDYLFALVTHVRTLLVYDLSEGRWVDEIENIAPTAVSPLAPDGESVLFKILAEDGLPDKQIVRYDLQTLTYEPLDGPFAFTPKANPRSWAWVELDDPEFPGTSLVMSFMRGYYVWNLETRSSNYVRPDVGAGAPLQAIGSGPNGAIYAGAHLSPPGMGRYDPDADELELLRGTRQVDAFGIHGDLLIIGRYPKAGFSAYDVTQPYDPGANPKPGIELGQEQDRPMDIVSVDHRVAVASAPESGKLGGALALWDPTTDHVDVYRNVVDDQTPVSLASRDGLIYGGTSVYGGFAVDPVTDSGKIFAWDAEAEEVVFEVVPVEGARNVHGLVFDDEGMLWGLADGSLFTFDPEAREVVYRRDLFSDDDNAQNTGRYGHREGLIFHEGVLYGVTQGNFFRVNPDILGVVEILASEGATGIAQDRNGDFYYFRSSHLFRWDTEDLSGDACPVGFSTDETVTFGDSHDSGVPNHDRGDGCTILDLIWSERPFADHGDLIRAVRDTTSEFVDLGLLTGRERGEITRAAAQSEETES